MEQNQKPEDPSAQLRDMLARLMALIGESEPETAPAAVAEVEAPAPAKPKLAPQCEDCPVADDCPDFVKEQMAANYAAGESKDDKKEEEEDWNDGYDGYYDDDDDGHDGYYDDDDDEADDDEEDEADDEPEGDADPFFFDIEVPLVKAQAAGPQYPVSLAGTSKRYLPVLLRVSAKAGRAIVGVQEAESVVKPLGTFALQDVDEVAEDAASRTRALVLGFQRAGVHEFDNDGNVWAVAQTYHRANDGTLHFQIAGEAVNRPYGMAFSVPIVAGQGTAAIAAAADAAVGAQ